MRNRRQIFGFSISAAFLLLIIDRKTAFYGASQGIDVCISSVIPSLYPFLFLSSVLISMLSESSPDILQFPCKLLGIPKGAECILIPAFLGGYPVGAECIGQAYCGKRLSEKEANRLLWFCSNAGPAFLFGITGSLYPDWSMVFLSWSITILSAATTAALCPAPPSFARPIHSNKLSISEIMRKSMTAMGSICCWIILFRILISYEVQIIGNRIPPLYQIVLTGILELTNGCFALTQISDIHIRFVLCNFFLCFGGICVALQTASVIGDLSLTDYIKGKSIQAIISIILSFAALFHPLMLLLPTISLIGVFFLKETRNSSNSGSLMV